MAYSIFSLVPPVALIILLQVSNYCSALTLPVNVSSSLTTINVTSLSDRPEYFDLPEVPGYKIQFEGYGTLLIPNDCLDALIVAQFWLLGEADKEPSQKVTYGETRSFIIGSVVLTVTIKNAPSYSLVALFPVGLMEWGNDNGFKEVKEISFLGDRKSPIATAALRASGPALTADQTNQTNQINQTNQTNNVTGLSLLNSTDPLNDPFLFPILFAPGFYIRYMTYNSPLPRYDCLRALEDADATLLSAYQQQIRIFNRPRSWAFGQANFTLTAGPELRTIDATFFVAGVMQLGAEKGFAVSRGIFLRTDSNLKGQMRYYGAGRLESTVKKAVE